MNFLAMAHGIEEDIRPWRHNLRQNPELSGGEQVTALIRGKRSDFSRIRISKFPYHPEENS